ncbi:hypothetical protein [Campylobacter phage vB_Cj_QDYZ]|uniref:Uncharacterized protein n=1 Tax=Campylobacter phage vB_Cj_QDYZ TaxID=3032374 RepID=A0AAF0JYN5_9CAUD|nr:hypothetical protein [Campylobacter phage vB_Cj_QDYZ]
MAQILSQEEIDALLEIDNNYEPENNEIQNTISRKIKDLQDKKQEIDVKIKAIKGLSILKETEFFTIRDYLNIASDLLDCLDYKINYGQKTFDSIINTKAQDRFLNSLKDFKSELLCLIIDMDIV